MNLSKPVKVTVASKDIREGYCLDCLKCPIALAFRRLFPGMSVDVTTSWVTVYDYNRDKVAVFTLPIRARNFISNFDSGKIVDPFTFTAVP